MFGFDDPGAMGAEIADLKRQLGASLAWLTAARQRMLLPTPS